MENIIEELIGIEANANNIVKESIEEQKKLSILIHERTKKIAEEFKLETDEKIRELQLALENQTVQQLVEIEKNSIEKLNQIENDFINNSPSWIEQIVSNVTR